MTSTSSIPSADVSGSGRHKVRPDPVGKWRTAAILLGALFTVSLTLDLWGLRPFGGPYDPSRAGTWASFIEAFSTSAAVIIGVRTFISEGRRFREDIERQDARHRAEQLMRERADRTQFFAWLRYEGLEGSLDWFLVVENLTKAPIYRWSVFMPGQATLTDRQMGPARPGTSEIRMPSLKATAPADAPRPRLIFADSLAEEWERTAEGDLRAFQAGDSS